MLVEILTHTPTWVWLLLAFLLSRGVAAMGPREVSPGRVLIVPVVFLVWGVSGLISVADGLWLKVALFAAALLVGLAIGRALASLAEPPRLSRVAGTIALPGSAAPLILIVLAFATKYVGSVALTLAGDVAVKAELAAALAATSGLFAGIFWGRMLGQFQRALQAEGRPATLATLARLLSGPARADAPERLS